MLRWLDALTELVQHVAHILLACVQAAEVITTEVNQEEPSVPSEELGENASTQNTIKHGI